MKIGKYNVTVKNIWAYIQGNTRKIVDELGPELFKSPEHIQEQIIWRDVIHNPICSKVGNCQFPVDNPCHCTVPDKFYADKACEGGCYPQIMDKLTWYKFKQLCARKKINIYNDKFDWDVILSEIGGINEFEFSSLIGLEDATQNVGSIKKGDSVQGKFELFNPFTEKLKINVIKPSCSCVTSQIPASVEQNEYSLINFTVNTKHKDVGQHNVWLTVRYNEIKRINLKIEFTVV